MSCNCLTIQAGERVLVGFNWSPLLTPMYASVDTTEWSIETGDGGLALDGDSVDEDKLKTSVWITGGTVSQTYRVRNRCTLDSTGVELADMEITVLE